MIRVLTRRSWVVSSATREVFIKVSGITNLEDAKFAASCRVDALGFIFSKNNPRSIDSEACAGIIRELPSHISKVGEFIGSDRQHVRNVLSRVNLSAAQIDGPFGADDLVDFETSVIKVFRIGRDFDIDVMKNYLVDAFLLDACFESSKGSGERVYCWDIALQARNYGRVILAGGLNPENVAEAVRFVQPYGVSVCTGVESKPGVLNRERLREFVSNAKAVRLLDENDDLSSEYP